MVTSVTVAIGDNGSKMAYFSHGAWGAPYGLRPVEGAVLCIQTGSGALHNSTGPVPSLAL